MYPTYITNHNNARTLIRKLDRDLLLIYEINRVAYGAGKREVDPRFFFKAIKQNMLWLDTVGK